MGVYDVYIWIEDRLAQVEEHIEARSQGEASRLGIHQALRAAE